MSSDDNLASWRLSTDSCPVSFLEGNPSHLWFLGKSWSLGTLAVLFFQEGQEDRMLACYVWESVRACLGVGEACSHSQTPLSLWTIEAAMAEPVSVVLTSGLSPKNLSHQHPFQGEA